MTTIHSFLNDMIIISNSRLQPSLSPPAIIIDWAQRSIPALGLSSRKTMKSQLLIVVHPYSHYFLVIILFILWLFIIDMIYSFLLLTILKLFLIIVIFLDTVIINLWVCMFGRDCGVRMHSNLMNTANTSMYVLAMMRNRRAKNLGVFRSQRNWSGWMTARWVNQFDLVFVI